MDALTNRLVPTCDPDVCCPGEGSPSSAPEAASGSPDACDGVDPDLPCVTSDPLWGPDDAYDHDRYNNGNGPLYTPAMARQARNACIDEAASREEHCVEVKRDAATIKCTPHGGRPGRGVDMRPVAAGGEPACVDAHLYGRDATTSTEACANSSSQTTGRQIEQGGKVTSGGSIGPATLEGEASWKRAASDSRTTGTGTLSSEAKTTSAQPGWAGACDEAFQKAVDRCSVIFP